jgi:uracil-DNA glycosylase
LWGGKVYLGLGTEEENQETTFQSSLLYNVLVRASDERKSKMTKGKAAIEKLQKSIPITEEPTPPPGLPLHCQQCGLWKGVRTYCIGGREDQRATEQGKPFILIVGQAPGQNEDWDGKIFTGPSGRFLQKYLDELECRWRLTNAVRCFPGKDYTKGGDNKPKAKQLEACSVYLREEITKYDPKVIICLGEVAMKAVLGKGAPNTITQASRQIVDLDGVKVLSNFHPSNDASVSPQRGMDLHDSYVAMFQLAERIVHGQFTEKKLDHAIVFDPDWELPDWVREIVLDIEWDANDNDPIKKTIHHPAVVVLCISITYRKRDGSGYITSVLAGDALNARTLSKALRGRFLINHNVVSELLVLEVKYGLKVFDLLKGYFCTFAFFLLQDQSKFGNGLKALAQKYFMAGPWEVGVWNQVKGEIDRRKAMNTAIRKENRQRQKDGEEPLELLPLHADFSHVNLMDLMEYCGNDTHEAARLYYEQRPKMWQPSDVLWNLMMTAVKVLQRLMVVGLPVDQERVDRIANAARKKVRQIQHLLCKQPEVKAVLDGWTDSRERWVKPGQGNPTNQVRIAGYRLDSQWGPEAFNVKSWKFMESLAFRLQYHTWERTETGRLKFDKMTMQKLIGSPHEERTREQWIWYYLYHLSQLRHLGNVFLKSWQEYAVDGRIHATFKIGKAESSGQLAGSDTAGGTETGRTATANPNISNIKKDKLLRSCITIPGGDWLVGEIDYNQQEVVYLAFESRDVGLRKACLEGDPHEGTARIMYQIPKDQPLDPNFMGMGHREIGKRMNFGKQYGQMPETLAAMWGMDLGMTIEFYQVYDEAFPGVKIYFDAIEADVLAGKMIYTAFGRRRSFELTGDRRMDAHRILEAKNYRIQSPCQDITTTMLGHVYDYLDETGLIEDIVPINMVYDAPWFQVRNDPHIINVEFPKIAAILEDVQRLPIGFDIPLRTTMKLGRTMAKGDLKELIV